MQLEFFPVPTPFVTVKNIITTIFPTEKYFIIERSLSCNNTCKQKKSQLQLQKKTPVITILTNIRKSRWQPHTLKKYELQPYLQVATIINNDKTITCALCNNLIGDGTGRPQGSQFTDRTTCLSGSRAGI
jgi:hypothetical protein